MCVPGVKDKQWMACPGLCSSGASQTLCSSGVKRARRSTAADRPIEIDLPPSRNSHSERRCPPSGCQRNGADGRGPKPPAQLLEDEDMCQQSRTLWTCIRRTGLWARHPIRRKARYSTAAATAALILLPCWSRHMQRRIGFLGWKGACCLACAAATACARPITASLLLPPEIPRGCAGTRSLQQS